MNELERKVSEQYIKSIFNELCNSEDNYFWYGYDVIMSKDSSICFKSTKKLTRRHGDERIDVDVYVKDYVDDDNKSILLWYHIWDVHRNRWRLNHDKKIYVKYLVSDISTFMYRLLNDRKIDNDLVYKNAKKIASSTYAKQLCDITFVIHDQ